MNLTTERKIEAIARLEGLVDSYGMKSVLSMLSEIASLKADHVRENWYDEGIAKMWDRDASMLDKASKKTVTP